MPRKIPDQLTKIMMNEAENPWQEIIDWLYYDYNKAPEGARLEILADIRYLEWLGDGDNRNDNHKKRYGKIAKNNTSLLRRVLEAEETFALVYNDGKCYSYLALFDGFSEDYNVGYKLNTPYKLVENIKDTTKFKDRDGRAAARTRKYKKANRAKVREANRIYRHKNKERIQKYALEYYHKNKERINARRKKIRELKKGTRGKREETNRGG